MEASGWDEDERDPRTISEEEGMLPPEERELTEADRQTNEQILRQLERQRRARLTFWVVVGIGVLLSSPFAGLMFGIMVRVFKWAAGV